jgi:hypothetical protein
MTYRSAQALRTALEHRLLARSAETGVNLDRLRRRVLFDHRAPANGNTVVARHPQSDGRATRRRRRGAAYARRDSCPTRTRPPSTAHKGRNYQWHSTSDCRRPYRACLSRVPRRVAWTVLKGIRTDAATHNRFAPPGAPAQRAFGASATISGVPRDGRGIS